MNYVIAGIVSYFRLASNFNTPVNRKFQIESDPGDLNSFSGVQGSFLAVRLFRFLNALLPLYVKFVRAISVF